MLCGVKQRATQFLFINIGTQQLRLDFTLSVAPFRNDRDGVSKIFYPRPEAMCPFKQLQASRCRLFAVFAPRKHEYQERYPLHCLVGFPSSIVPWPPNDLFMHRKGIIKHVEILFRGCLCQISEVVTERTSNPETNMKQLFKFPIRRPST